MPLSMYQASVPVYARLLKGLVAVLDKAARHAAEKKIEPAILISARLYPDMWSLAEQVRAACNHGTRGPARLSGSQIPQYDGGDDGSFDGLKTRVAWILAFLDGLNAEQFEGAEARTIVFPAGDSERRMTGADYLLTFSMPNFCFHVTAAYAILRHNGVPLDKDDFLGPE
jgi:hypothetical protein